MTVSRTRDVLGLTAFVVLCFGVSVLGGRATALRVRRAGTRRCAKPSWTPPRWVFGPVWTLLYPLVAVAGWLAWREGRARVGPLALPAAAGAQRRLALALLRATGASTWRSLCVVALVVAILATIVAFWRVSRGAALLMVPYLAWVGFAAALNHAIWRLNWARADLSAPRLASNERRDLRASGEPHVPPPLPLSPRALSSAAARRRSPRPRPPAGEIRGRVLVDGKPAPASSCRVLPFEDGFAAARREARREELPKPLAAATTRPDGSVRRQRARARRARPSASPSPAPRGRAARARRRSSTRRAKTRATCGCRRPSPSPGGSWTSAGGPVVGATVTLWPGGGRRLAGRAPALRRAAARDDGPTAAFRFEAAAEEGNRLRVEAPAFATLERQPVRGGALARPVALALGQVLRGTVTPRRPAHARPAARSCGSRAARRRRAGWRRAPDGAFVARRRAARAGLARGRRRRPRPRLGGARRGARPSRRSIALAPTATLSGRVVDADGAGPSRRRARGPRPRAGSSSRARARTAATRSAGWRPQPLPADRRGRPLRAVVASVRVAAGPGRDAGRPAHPRRDARGPGGGRGGRADRGRARPAAARRRERVPGLHAPHGGRGDAVRTGRDGSFRATRLAPGENQRLDVRHDDYEERAIGGISLSPGATRGGRHRRPAPRARAARRREGRGGPAARRRGGRPVGRAHVPRGPRRHADVVHRPGQPGAARDRRGRPLRVPGPEAGRLHGLRAAPGLLARERGPRQGGARPARPSRSSSCSSPGATISGVLHDKSGNGASGWYVARARREPGRRARRSGPASTAARSRPGPTASSCSRGSRPGESYELQAIGQRRPRSAQGRGRGAGGGRRARRDRHRPDPRARRGRRQRPRRSPTSRCATSPTRRAACAS